MLPTLSGLPALLIALLCCQVHAEEHRGTAPTTSLAARIVHTAIAEHKRFDGHRINAGGYLWKFGLAESEAVALRHPAAGQPDQARSGGLAWRRVWEYWLTLDAHVPGEALARKLISAPGILEDPDITSPRSETALADLLAAPDDRNDIAGSALRQAAVRAAMNDSPWSAAFISHVMHQAGLSDAQFRYAAAHWRYIKSAFEAGDESGYAYRARDPRRTTPRPGDLLCYSRGNVPLTDFNAWRGAVRTPGFSAGSHCEVVVRVDLDADKMETIGGNVLHSVARRDLKLNADHRLSATHHPDTAGTGGSRNCRADQACRTNNLNIQYWSVLLQLQP